MNYVSRESMKRVQQKTVPNRMTTVRGLLSRLGVSQSKYTTTFVKPELYV